MKSFLFTLIGSTGQNLIDGLRVVLELIINIQTKLYAIIIGLIAVTFRWLLFLIDKDRVQHAEECVNQNSMVVELTILSQISDVKEDALRNKAWTSAHSGAISMLGSRLYNECEWEEDKIHDYMRAVVESIPGLTYAVGDEDDDEGIPLED